MVVRPSATGAVFGKCRVHVGVGAQSRRSWHVLWKVYMGGAVTDAVKQSDADATRRSFITRLFKGTIAAGIASVIGSIAAYLVAPEEVRSSLGPQRMKVAKSDEIPVGGGKLALFNEEPVWIVRRAREFVAVSALCTHKGCVVKWDAGRRLFACPCHEARFDENGNVLAGLPRRPLPHFRVAAVGDELYLSRGDHRSL